MIETIIVSLPVILMYMCVGYLIRSGSRHMDRSSLVMMSFVLAGLMAFILLNGRIGATEAVKLFERNMGRVVLIATLLLCTQIYYAYLSKSMSATGIKIVVLCGLMGEFIMLTRESSTQETYFLAFLMLSYGTLMLLQK